MTTTEWAQWRVKRDAELRDPHGWLSLTALYWLGREPTSFPEVPGRWSAGPSGVTISATAAEGLTVAESLVDGVVTVAPADGEAGERATFADQEVEIIRRGAAFAIRVRDPHAPTLAAFAGVPSFPVSPEWVIEGRFAAFESPRAVTVGAVVEGLTHRQTAPGIIHFSVRGEDYTLTAFEGRAGLSVLFRDATSGVTTYAALRALAVDVPDAEGRVVLDFNRATNLPCAFTDFATCPLPPPENVLTLAVEAGEKTPR
jgi:uncharacterized protein (DUF1684 family)